MNLRRIGTTLSVTFSFCCAGASPVLAEGEIVKATSDQSFTQDVLKSTKPVLVDFYADWCRPCKLLSPVVESLAQKYDGKVVFYKLNVDNCPKTSELYAVRAIPALKIFRNGKVVAETLGEVPSAVIDAKLAAALK